MAAAANTQKTTSAPAAVWSWQERIAGRIDSWLGGPLDTLLMRFTGGAVIQYHPARCGRLDAWARDGVFNLVVGRFWLEVELRGTVAQQVARKAEREAERKAALWSLGEREDFESGV